MSPHDSVSASRNLFLLLASFGITACGIASEPSTPPPPPPAVADLTLLGEQQQAAAAGTAVAEPVTVLVRDATGAPVLGRTVHFSVTSGGGWVVPEQALTSADGQAATTWYLGPVPGSPQQLQATVGTRSVMAGAVVVPLVPGQTYSGHLGYVEFTAGDAQLILSASHGGDLTPAEIPNRTVGTSVTDTNTDPLAREMAAAFLTETGRRPHLVIVRLRRTKLDANREIVEAAQGHPLAERAWREYHGFIEAAKVAAAASGPRPFYVDVHGHGHPIGRLELGYLLTASDLARTDLELNAGPFAAQSSIRGLAATSTIPFAELLRGPSSLGGRLVAEGYPAVPSPAAPSPGTDPYFNGGYSTARHGGLDGGFVNGVQLEAHYSGVRDTEANRKAFAAAAARAVAGFLGMEGPVGSTAASEASSRSPRSARR